jgi:hypothetical protein
MTGNRYARMGSKGRKPDWQSQKLKELMGGSTKYYVAKNRVDDCWEVRQYKDDKPVATSFDTQGEAEAKMKELDDEA